MHRRKGFTLVETIVTLAVMAVLVAVMAPTVIQKADDGDPVRLANDLRAIGTGVQVFATDVKGVFPGDLEDLTQRVVPTNAVCATTLSCDSVISHRATYTPEQVVQWSGPYLAASIGFQAGSQLRSGFAGQIQNTLHRFDANRNAIEQFSAQEGVSNSNCAIGLSTFCDQNQLFVAVAIVQLTPSELQQLNGIIDGSNEGTAPGALGRFRYIGSTGYYLASPISQPLTDQAQIQRALQGRP